MPRSLLLAIALALAAGPAVALDAIQLSVGKAIVTTDEVLGGQVLQISFDKSERQALAQFTANHVSATVDISVDATLLTSPMIMEPIVNGVVVVSGGEPEIGWDGMALQLNAKKAQVKFIVRD